MYVYMLYTGYLTIVYTSYYLPQFCARVAKKSQQHSGSPRRKKKKKNEKMKQMKLKMCRKIALPFSSRIIPAPLVV